MEGARRRRMGLAIWAIITAMALHGCCVGTAGQMDAGDESVLLAFLRGLKNPSKLDWSGSDACLWQGIKCQGSFVSGINVAGYNLGGTLTPQINRLSSLTALSLQRNGFTGALPSLSGLSNLQSCYLNDNQFDSIPPDFFQNLSSLQFMYLTNNNQLNLASGGWSLSTDLQSSPHLTNLSLTNTSLIGQIPEFLGSLGNLNVLGLAYNRLGGGIPQSFAASNLQQFQANNQWGPQLSGTLDVVASMQSLTQLWLHENKFSGTLPADLATSAVSLKDLRLNGNRLVGPIPASYSKLPLTEFAVENNQLDGPIPVITGTFTYSNNYFCQNTSGVACAPQVTALLDFLGSVNYPTSIVSSWKGNNPCSSWIGITCDQNGNVVVINLVNSHLSGTINPALAQLTYLTTLKLNGNNLTGAIPSELTSLQSLKTLDVSNNNITGPVPIFPTNVVLNTTGNQFINVILPPSSPPGSPTGNTTPGRGSKSSSVPIAAIVAPVLGAVVILLLTAVACFTLYKKYPEKFELFQGVTRLPVHAQELNGKTGKNKLGVETERLAISMAALQKATNNFSEENFLGKGGFGSVYKGHLEDGTVVAVKRMEAAVVTSKGLKEFQAEITVLTKVRHRHLVDLLGYCIEGTEKILVYEYMSQGTLSHHLFDRAQPGLKPLSWKSRLIIALDVARGIEYLHGLAQTSFIHRDLKPSNILLDDNFRAKVSDFGLVKLAPEGSKHSVETRVAGTFGYLAPEYAVTGRITTKADVFSFGVVLMELITGRRVLDDTQTEEKYHLVPWFRRLIGNKDELLQAVDPVIEVTDGIRQSIFAVAELSGHCTVREPQQRPDMSHAVNVLAPLVQEWKPSGLVEDETGPFGPSMTYEEAKKKWRFLEDSTGNGLNDTRTTFPSKSARFGEASTST